MDKDLRKELMRKSMHLFSGIIFSALIYFKIALWWHFSILLLVGSFLMFYIHKTKTKIPLIINLTDNMGREKELPGLGAMTFLAGVTIATLLFTKEIAAASILILAVGDSVSPIIGRHFGKTKTIFSKKKLIEGFVIGVILSIFAAAQIVGYMLAISGSIIALFAEFWDETDFIDDNILIPLVAGTVMTLIMLI